MIMEIGGFFEFQEFDCSESTNSVYDYLTNINENQSFFRDGRQAIKSVLLNINGLKDKTCYLPSYLCSSIFMPFKELNLNVYFYKHQSPLKPMIDKDIEDSLIYIIDYFGTEFISNKEINYLLDKNNIVILDITHSIFNKNRFKIKHESLYKISSLRKMFPIPDGGILYHSNHELKVNKSPPEGYENMIKAMILKASYIKNNNKTNLKNTSDMKNNFLTIYKNYEKNKDNSTIQLQSIPSFSIHILKNISILNIIKRRTENLKDVYKNLLNKKYSLFHIKDIKSPYILPLIFENEKQRDNVASFLIKEKIYPPIHWNLPDIIPNEYSYEHELNKKILSIPIDQRYSKEDMSRVVDALKEVITS